ncbi:alpha/beta hydrolase [Flavicella marina]|uniref:alpha/beta hydrolase n=1 Tax=Flavicella marina TaxID=1475951 RepID=UPI0012646127|nr:alpha/beta hydrolase [Flavicella marina]
MDLEKDFLETKIPLGTEDDGEIFATLVSSKQNKKRSKAVLYIHGYIDYFFHPHVCEEFHQHKFDFYALDLRRYGRSLKEHHKPNYCEAIEEYFQEITEALQIILETNEQIYLLGHSTGGLITLSYMNSGDLRYKVKGLLLNSPFLEFAQPLWLTNLMYFGLKPLSKLIPYGKSNKGLSPIYAESMHKNYFGEWDFDLRLKPIKGYPVYFKWFLAIVSAQRRLRKSSIHVPILLLHSNQSFVPKSHSELVKRSDTVLDIKHMKERGPYLGSDVTLIEIEDGVHDLFLSPKLVRKHALAKMFEWLLEN